MARLQQHYREKLAPELMATRSALPVAALKMATLDW